MSEYKYDSSALAKKAFTGWAWNLVLQISTIGLSGAVFLISSLYLEPHDFGIVAFAAASVALISAVMPTAFGQALVQQEHVQERHLQTVFWLCVGSGALAYLIILISSPFLAKIQNASQLTPIVAALGTKLVFDGLNTVPNAILQRRMSFRTLATRSIAASVVGATSCFLLIYMGAPIWGLVLSQAINPMVSTIVLYWVTRWRPQGFADTTSLRELSGFGIFVFGGQLLNQARIDQLIMGATLGPIGLGLYYFSHRIYTLCLDVTGGAFTAVSNTIFAAVQGDDAKRRLAFETASFASTCIGFPVFTGLIVIAPKAIPYLFGIQWESAVPMIRALGGIGIMATLGVIQGSMITYFGHVRWWFTYQLVVQAIGWVLIVLISPYGTHAVVAALLLRTVLLWPFSVWKTAIVLDIKIQRYIAALASPALASVAMATIIEVTPWNIIELNEMASLFAMISSGAVTYVTFIMILSGKRISSILMRDQP